MVTVADEARPLVGALLGRTRIVDDLDIAVGSARQWPGRFDYVTPAGDLLSRHGVFTGGVAGGSGKAAASILGRKNQIAALQEEVAAIQEQVAEAGRRNPIITTEFQ